MSYWTPNGFVKDTDESPRISGDSTVHVGTAAPQTSEWRPSSSLSGPIRAPRQSASSNQRPTGPYFSRNPSLLPPLTTPSRSRPPSARSGDGYRRDLQPISSARQALPPALYDVRYIRELAPPDETDKPSDLEGMISESEIRRVRKCGSGGFGDVFFLHHALLGDIALKRIREVGDMDVLTDERRRARREAKIWHGLEHPNVLEFHGVYETPFHFFFVSPFVNNGTIVEYIKKNPDVDRLRLLTEAARGLAYLHSEKIIHGDVKAANILISDDVHALICDFGMTRPFDSATSTALHTAGSVRWMSPETMNGETRTPASDVWAFGMSISEVLSGLVPYAALRNDVLVAKAIMDGKERPPMKPESSLCGISYQGTWGVASQCWSQGPEARPGMDRVVEGLVHSRLRSYTLEGHKEFISAVSFSPDSCTLGSASADYTIRLWDVSQAIPLGEPLEGHTGNVNSVTFSPDGTTLVSGSSDCTLRLWDVSTGRTIGEPLTGHAYGVFSVSLSPDGRTIASGSNDSTIRIWDSVSRTCIAVLEGHTWSVTSVVFSPDGKTLVSGSWDNTNRRWDMKTYAPIGEPMKGHADYLRSVAISPDGSTIASGSDDKTVRLWDARSGKPKVPPLEGHTSFVISVAFHPNGRLLASGSLDKTLRIWDLTTAPPTTKLVLKDHTNYVCSVAFSLDGKWLASGSDDKKARLWDLEVLLGTV